MRVREIDGGGVIVYLSEVGAARLKDTLLKNNLCLKNGAFRCMDR